MRADDLQTQLRAGQSKELAETRQAQRLEVKTRKDHGIAVEACNCALATVEDMQNQLVSHLHHAGLPDTLSADDFAAWVQDVEEARATEQAYETVREEQQDLIGEATRLRAELSTCLGINDGTLGGLFKIAKSHITQMQAQQQVLKLATAAARNAQAETTRRSEREAKAQEDVELALAHWSALIVDLLPELKAEVASWDGVQALRSVREADVRITGLRRQIGGITRNSAQFDAALDTFGEDSRDLPALDRYGELQTRVAKAQQADHQTKDLKARLDQQEAVRTQCEQALTILDDQVRTLALLFDDTIPTDSLEQLRAATATAQEAIGLWGRSSQVLRLVLMALAVISADDAVVVLENHPLETAQIELADTVEELDRLDPTVDMAIETRTRTQVEVDAVGGDNDIALLTEAKRALEEQMQAGLLDYLTGRFGYDLAEESIRRYRDSHRSGMLAATEKAFSDLTQGAYSKLITQPGGNGDVLMAVQTSDGVSKEAAAMSKGTRFQLYLALRAAAYDQMASNGTVLPFFCDDVFETFDENRTRAACTLMQRVGRTGQAIYLTHHQHVVDLAQDVCGDQVQIHRL
jgi:uncharacterized protein YhaN